MRRSLKTWQEVVIFSVCAAVVAWFFLFYVP